LLSRETASYEFTSTLLRQFVEPTGTRDRQNGTNKGEIKSMKPSILITLNADTWKPVEVQRHNMSEGEPMLGNHAGAE